MWPHLSLKSTSAIIRTTRHGGWAKWFWCVCLINNMHISRAENEAQKAWWTWPLVSTFYVLLLLSCHFHVKIFNSLSVWNLFPGFLVNQLLQMRTIKMPVFPVWVQPATFVTRHLLSPALSELSDEAARSNSFFFFFFCILTLEYSFCLTKAWQFSFCLGKNHAQQKTASYGRKSSLLFIVEQSCPTPAAEQCHSFATKQINSTNLFVGDASSMGFIEISVFFNLFSLNLMTCFISSVYSISLHFEKQNVIVLSKSYSLLFNSLFRHFLPPPSLLSLGLIRQERAKFEYSACLCCVLHQTFIKT